MDILEQAKNINKKVKEGKIFGKYTKEEAKAKLGEMKKKNLKSNIKKAVSTVSSLTPVGAAKKTAKNIFKYVVPKDIKRDIKKKIKLKGGGIALRGLGRAFMKGGKV